MLFRELNLILKFTEQLWCWLDQFMDNTRQLAKEFAAVRAIHDNVVAEAVRRARLGQYDGKYSRLFCLSFICR